MCHQNLLYAAATPSFSYFQLFSHQKPGSGLLGQKPSFGTKWKKKKRSDQYLGLFLLKAGMFPISRVLSRDEGKRAAEAERCLRTKNWLYGRSHPSLRGCAICPSSLPSTAPLPGTHIPSPLLAGQTQTSPNLQYSGHSRIQDPKLPLFYGAYVVFFLIFHWGEKKKPNQNAKQPFCWVTEGLRDHDCHP